MFPVLQISCVAWDEIAAQLAPGKDFVFDGFSYGDAWQTLVHRKDVLGELEEMLEDDAVFDAEDVFGDGVVTQSQPTREQVSAICQALRGMPEVNLICFDG